MLSWEIQSFCLLLLTRFFQEKLAFCEETLAAREAGYGYASALRRVAKRHQAIATAQPFALAIIALGNDFLYCNGHLCYSLNNSLRILNVHGSGNSEVVVSIPGLLRNFLLESAQGTIGRFRILYFNEGIISCLYTVTASESVAYLISIDINNNEILLTQELPCTEKIFVRHNSQFLYYGTFSEENHQGHKKWTLRGYRFEEKAWFQQRIFLGHLNGSDIGATICFEIFDGYFYALSSQTNYEVEEVDWTSFYHCVRFPVACPSKWTVEKTEQDETMWRRQHREGPVDDRWASLALRVDEATGELKIVEARKEFLFGASRSQRTYYMTKLVFPTRVQMETDESQSSTDTGTTSNTVASASMDAVIDEPLSSTEGLPHERDTLAALTQDRLALTLRASDNPHWLPPQTRYPKNVHPGDDGCFIFSQTFLRYYNSSASSFLDLVDARSPQNPGMQRLRLRVGSRKLKPPERAENGILFPEASDPRSGEVLYGLNDRYRAREISFWPPEQDVCEMADPRMAELSTLMNPPGFSGCVEATGDERSLIYATGGKGEPMALIFVSFDPSIKLMGLRKWHEAGRNDQGGAFQDSLCGSGSSNGNDTTHSKDEEKERHEEMAWQEQRQPLFSGDASVMESTSDHLENNNDSQRWIWRVPAMYRTIDRGFDFSL